MLLFFRCSVFKVLSPPAIFPSKAFAFRTPLPFGGFDGRAAFSRSLFRLCAFRRKRFGLAFSRSLFRLCAFRRKRLVGLSGLEPPTSRLSGVRSNHLSYKPLSSSLLWSRAGLLSFSHLLPPGFPGFGGDEENRTPDPLLARQVLSQLSYTPVFLHPGSFPSSFLLL